MRCHTHLVVVFLVTVWAAGFVIVLVFRVRGIGLVIVIGVRCILLEMTRSHPLPCVGTPSSTSYCLYTWRTTCKFPRSLSYTHENYKGGSTFNPESGPHYSCSPALHALLMKLPGAGERYLGPVRHRLPAPPGPQSSSSGTYRLPLRHPQLRPRALRLGRTASFLKG